MLLQIVNCKINHIPIIKKRNLSNQNENRLSDFIIIKN